MSLWDTYPYLWESAILLALGLSTLWILPRHRRSLILSIVLLLPAATNGRYFVPAYWDPVITVRFICSPADLCWVASSGISTWFLAILPFHRRVTVAAPSWKPFGWMIVCYLCGGVLFEILHRTILTRPEDVMPASLLVLFVAVAFFAWRRPRELPLAVAGCIGFSIIHFINLWVGFLVWPHSKDVWTPGAQLPWELLGVPGWEVVWGLCFGFAWPLVLAEVTGIRLLPADRKASPTITA